MAIKRGTTAGFGLKGLQGFTTNVSSRQRFHKADNTFKKVCSELEPVSNLPSLALRQKVSWHSFKISKFIELMCFVIIFYLWKSTYENLCSHTVHLKTHPRVAMQIHALLRSLLILFWSPRMLTMDARGETRSQSVVGCSADSPDEIKVAQAGKKWWHCCK